MRIQKKSRILALMLALLMSLSACGGNTQSPASSATEPNTPTGTAVPPVFTPVEESADVIATEGTPVFFTVNGLSYPTELGKPVLSERAAEMAGSVSRSSAAEQITNVGDAICYLQAAEAQDQPSDTCRLFAELLAGDYDEVGLIHLSHHDNYYCLAYVRLGDLFFPFDPFMLARGSSGWFYEPQYDCIRTTDPDALCEKLIATFPYNGENNPMESWQIEPLSVREAQAEAPSTESNDPDPTPQPPDVSTPTTPSVTPSEPAPPSQPAETPQAKFAMRKYTDEELQAFVDADLSFQEACEKLSTVSDVVQYLYLRGYKFQPEDQGTSAQLRYNLNSGACVGGSALLNALLEGDYDDQGYVYIFYARGEHVMPFFVMDGVYFYCDLVPVFNNGSTDISRNPISYMTKEPETFYDAWLEIEPHDLNDSESDMYLAAMFTTAYCGGPARSKVMLRESADGKYASIPLSTAEKESLQILFIRDGYTFDF